MTKASRGQSIGFERADELHAVRCLVGGDIPTVWIKIVVLGHCPAVQKKSPGAPRALPLDRKLAGIALAEQSSWSVGAAVTAAEERPEPIVQTNFEHLNLAARRESVSPERPRSKREVIQFEKVIFKLRRPISP